MLLLHVQKLEHGKEAVDRGLTGAMGSSSGGGYDPNDTGFGRFIGRLLTGILVIAAILLLIYLIWGAIEWITAGGDKSKIEKARDKITQSIIGVIVLASVLAIFSAVQRFLGIEVLTFLGIASSNSLAPASLQSVVDALPSSQRAAAEGAAQQAGNNPGLFEQLKNFFGIQ